MIKVESIKGTYIVGLFVAGALTPETFWQGNRLNIFLGPSTREFYTCQRLQHVKFMLELPKSVGK